MVVVVTGASGFIGGSVARTLERSGIETIAAGRPICELPSEEFSALLRGAEPDVVVHCAGPASVTLSITDPGADRRGSVDVTEAIVAECERLLRAPRFVLVSSAAVYGEPSRLPIREEDPTEPISPYGRHRLEAENVVRGAALPSSIARVFSAYGEGLARQLLWDVARKALAGGPVELWGTGRETRDFVHVDDVGRALAHVLAAAPFEGEVINVGTGTETAIADIASLLVSALRVDDVQLRFRGVEREGDPLRWQADVSALSLLGWEPEVTLEEGVTRYADWIRADAE